MDRDVLEHYLGLGLSLAKIGALVGRDPSTVGYWVRRHRLMPNGKGMHAPKGALGREQLEPLIEFGVTLQEMAQALGRSTSTVRYWMKRHKLERPRASREETEAAIRCGIRTLPRHCKRHGETEFAVVGSERRLRCKRCRAEAVAKRRRKVKQILVAEAGGRCQLCGYDRHVAALEFHHLDPSMKSFGLARRGITRSIEKVRVEAAKCVLLCANCHAEVEAGAASLP